MDRFLSWIDIALGPVPRYEVQLIWRDTYDSYPEKLPNLHALDVIPITNQNLIDMIGEFVRGGQAVRALSSAGVFLAWDRAPL